MENKVFIVFLLISTCAFFWLLTPFSGAIFWACAIAIIFYPFKKIVINRIGDHNNLASFLTLAFCCLIVIIPGFLVISMAVNESQELITKVRSEELNVDYYVKQIQSSIPLVEKALNKVGLNLEVLKSEFQESIKVIGGLLTKNSLLIGKSTLNFFLNAGIIMYVAFFLIRDGKAIMELILRAIPLGKEREERLFTKLTEVTRATIKGNIIVACVQGIIGGAAFWFLGINGAVLWMIAMTVAAMIPAIGSAIIWGPVAIYFFASGNYTNGIILSTIGVAVIGLIDNILRPILVGRDTKMPDYIVLVSTLCGLALFGINGFIIGPLIAAIFFVSWSIFIEEFMQKKALL